MSKQPTQADNTIHEDQLLNFLVNTLSGAFGVTLGENAEIDPADIYEVLVEGPEMPEMDWKVTGRRIIVSTSRDESVVHQAKRCRIVF